MSSLVESFAAQLRALGLVTPEKLASFLPPHAAPKDATELARELIRNGELTKFQAQEVLQGRGKSLTLGNYVVLDKLGAGGMGQVFKAQHRRMKRIVAIKTLPKNVMKDAAAVGRFQREVEAAAKLSHANVVAAFDADEADGVHFLVMEFVDGPDLNALLKRQRTLSVAEVTGFIAQAAEGLAFAHSKGVVHRDIKPGNLLVDKEGVVKVLDLGLARFDDDALGSEEQQNLTQQGLLMGTVDFMAPEQARNLRKADAKSDVYSLGCTLHRLLTGKCLYDGETVVDKLWAHRDQAIPSLRAVRPDVPPQLDALFMRMVAKRPEDRPTMTEIVAALRTPRSAVAAISVPALSVPTATSVPTFPTATLPMPTAPATIRNEPSDSFFVPPSIANAGLNVTGSTISGATLQGSVTIGGGPSMSGPSMSGNAAARSRRPAVASKSVNPVVLIGGGAGAIVALAVGLWIVVGGGSEPKVVAQPVAVVPKAVAPAQPVSPPKAVAPILVKPTPTSSANLFALPPSSPANTAQAPTNVTPPIATSTLPPTPAPSPTKMFALPASSPSFAATPAAATAGPPRAIAPFDAAQAKAHQKAWSDFLGVPVESTNSLGMKMILIPPGTFTMGSSPEQIEVAKQIATAAGAVPTQLKNLEAEGPQHVVTLTKPFLCSATEVTVDQFRRFVEATNYISLSEKRLIEIPDKIPSTQRGTWKAPNYQAQPASPVTFVAWYDASEFCNWLSKSEQFLPAYAAAEQTYRRPNYGANGYYLPTEAQWEYACRAGTTTAYYFGDDRSQLDKYVWHFGNLVEQVAPVAQKLPNPFGLYDMHGNAQEWTQCMLKPYGPEPETDPEKFGNDTVATRGAILQDGLAQYRSAARRSTSAKASYAGHGFRVIRPLEIIAKP
jgi:serine/threonine protein kinase/formylglycine-generating enzyme required for sulfatase activity